MKRVFFFFILFFASISLFSQKDVDEFELTAGGFVDFVVVDTDKTAEQIFTNIKKWAEYNLKNADYSNYSEVENEYLAYSFVDVKGIQAQDVITKTEQDIFLDVEIRIRDKKFRVDIIVKEYRFSDDFQKGYPLSLNDGWAKMFKKNGKPRTQRLYREGIEQTNISANAILKTITEAVEGVVDYKKTDW